MQSKNDIFSIGRGPSWYRRLAAEHIVALDHSERPTTDFGGIVKCKRSSIAAFKHTAIVKRQALNELLNPSEESDSQDGDVDRG